MVLICSTRRPEHRSVSGTTAVIPYSRPGTLSKSSCCAQRAYFTIHTGRTTALIFQARAKAATNSETLFQKTQTGNLPKCSDEKIYLHFSRKIRKRQNTTPKNMKGQVNIYFRG